VDRLLADCDMQLEAGIVLLIAFLYLLLVFRGPELMKYRPPYGLETSLFYWNLANSLFSFAAFLVSGSCVVYSIFNFGFWRSLDKVRWENDEICRTFGFAYTISKGVEFGDTIFLILRKRNVEFLHWFHHWLTYLVVWKWWDETHGMDGLARYLAGANVFVHFIMYGYYAAKSKNWITAEWVPMCITALQIVQMTYLCIGINLGYHVVPVVSWIGGGIGGTTASAALPLWNLLSDGFRVSCPLWPTFLSSLYLQRKATSPQTKSIAVSDCPKRQQVIAISDCPKRQ